MGAHLISYRHCDRMPLDRISQYKKTISSTIDPELLNELASKGGSMVERKMEPETSLSYFISSHHDWDYSTNFAKD